MDHKKQTAKVSGFKGGSDAGDEVILNYVHHSQWEGLDSHYWSSQRCDKDNYEKSTYNWSCSKSASQKAKPKADTRSYNQQDYQAWQLYADLLENTLRTSTEEDIPFRPAKKKLRNSTIEQWLTALFVMLTHDGHHWVPSQA